MLDNILNKISDFLLNLQKLTNIWVWYVMEDVRPETPRIKAPHRVFNVSFRGSSRGWQARPIAFCKICRSDLKVRTEITSALKRNKQWLIELECGHIFDWETGRCYTKEYFDLGLKQINNL